MSSEVANDTRIIKGIPINNLWLLMFWASDLYSHLVSKKIAIEENDDDNIADLIAEILCQQVEKRLVRNLSFGYRHRIAVLNRVRGRIDLLYTESHQLLKKAQVRCRFEELTVDTPRNRYVGTALEHLATIKPIAPKWKHRCRTLAMRLARIGVTLNKPSGYSARSERFGLHDSSDQIMLDAADLAFALALPTDTEGNHFLISPDDEVQDNHWLRKLFEKAIRGFYQVRLKDTCDVKSKNLYWNYDDTSDDTSDDIKDFLPSMQTDISIQKKSSAEQLIIDTKFNKITSKGHPRDKDKNKLRSGYIYQMYAYLRSQERADTPQSYTTTGMLLHPSIDTEGDEPFTEYATIQGHKFMFCTVNLGDKTTKIRERLLGLLDLLPLSLH